MNILIAPNAFKNSLTASEAAQAIEEGLYSSKLICKCECFPVADGGNGTDELLIKKLKGQYVFTKAHDPLGREINASFGLIDNGKTAVVEMANASGLHLLKPDELSPLIASSYGTGELIKKALDCGVTKIIIGMGGSATTDGGCGILKALGLRFLDSQKNELPDTPESLTRLDYIDISQMDHRIPDCEIVILCDVENELVGENGAARTFGPQKGASNNDVIKLECALLKLSQVVLEQTGGDMSLVKYGGTAGGAAAGLFVFLHAKLEHGIDYFLGITDFDKSLDKTDLVITGEGSIDDQTLNGKGPFGVARRAKKKNIPVIGIAGKVPLSANNKMNSYFDILLSIGNEPSDIYTAMQSTKINIQRTSKEIGNLIALADLMAS